ncbi:MAG: ComEC/Rec2 family competence protein [Lachnospiraceae bacterium]|nr:ComEC/Rec2 family competence protein [Lachnospiraceae bacterium]MCM1239482.1 ComEC/Rec2 family competence protein [Lachnospiraceae bacterium]
MRRPLLLAAICLVSVMGLLLHLGVFDRVPDGQIGAEALTAGEPVTFTGQVYQKDSEKFYLRSVRMISSAEISQPDIPCKDNFICIPEQETDIPLGSVVMMRGIFQPFSIATNPGEFDSREYYRTLGIGGRVRDAAVLARGESCWRLREALYQARNLLGQRLESIFPEREAAVMCALLLGDKEDLDLELKELYQRNGILHILSISSLHITMIGMSVYRLLRRCRMPVCPAAAGGCCLLILYGMMTGFGVSACRAIGMYLLRMMAEAAGRTYDMPTAMGVTAAALVVKNPYYLRHAGFLLSFTSMIGIGVVYPAMEKNGKKKTVKERLLEPVLSGLSITLATLPVQLWFYYQVPSYSVLLNILVLPFMKILMMAGFLTLIPGLGACVWADLLILRGYEMLCGVFDRFPFHTWNPGKPRLWQVIVYYLVLGAAVWGRKCLADQSRNAQEKRGQMSGGSPEKKPRTCCGSWKAYLERMKEKVSDAGTGRGCGIGIIVCLTGMLLAPLIFTWKPSAENRLLFLDVGQGDGILVRTASGENYLFDGGSSSRSQVGKYVLLPCLRYYGIQTLDAVILSHPDADHVNGAMELLSMGQNSGVKIKQLVLPELSEKGKAEMLKQLGQFTEQEDWSSRIPIGYLAAGESFHCDSAGFLCLHPESGWDGAGVNACSICIYGLFTDKKGKEEFDFLLTGDVEDAGEEALLAELRGRGIQGVDVLKVAHHGSKNSTSERLLEQAAPALSVISCGRNNRYGHPHQELLERLKNTECVILTTSERGAVCVSAEQGKIGVEAFR